MPVDPRYVDHVASAVAAVYAEAELALVRMVSRALAQDVDRPGWATRKLAEVSAVRRAAQLIVDAVEPRAQRAARAAVAAGYRAGNRAAVVELAERVAGDVGPWARGADTRRGSAVQALADAIVRELQPVHRAILPQTVNAYRSAVAGATARVHAGGIPQRQAAQAAWQALTDRGIVGFTDAAGRRWRLHTWVEMATRTAVQRAAIAGFVDELTAAGEDLVYVTDTAGECEMCRPWEHRVLSLGALTAGPHRLATPTGRRVTVLVAGTVDEARAAGLFHPNCRHALARYIVGRTRLARVVPNPAAYAARQQQRYLERQVRHWREREAAALDPATRAAAARKVTAWEGTLVEHVERHRLQRLRYREQIGAGFEAPPSRRGDAVTITT